MAVISAWDVPGGTVIGAAWAWITAHSRLVLAGLALTAVAGACLWIYRQGASSGRADGAEELRETGLAQLNERARARQTIIAYKDSMRTIYSREAEQREIIEDERDAYARELQLQRQVVTSYRIQIDDLRDSATAVVRVDSADVRRATFVATTDSGPPATITADVELPPPPLPGRFQYQLALGPIPMRSLISCGPPVAPHGLRPVVSEIELPPYMRGEILETVADPRAGCNPLPLELGTWERIKIGAPYAAGGALVTLVVIAGLVLAK